MSSKLGHLSHMWPILLRKTRTFRFIATLKLEHVRGFDCAHILGKGWFTADAGESSLAEADVLKKHCMGVNQSSFRFQTWRSYCSSRFFWTFVFLLGDPSESRGSLSTGADLRTEIKSTVSHLIRKEQSKSFSYLQFHFRIQLGLHTKLYTKLFL